MGLKHGEDPFAASRSRSFQRGANFRRVMGVIINKQEALAFILNLEPPPRVFEFVKRSCDCFKRNSKLDCELDHTQRILNSTRVGGTQRNFAHSSLPKRAPIMITAGA